MIINPFITIKEMLQREVDISLFPLKNLVDQYSSLGEEKWKDLELTTSFLDVTLELLEGKIRKLFNKKADLKIEEEEEVSYFYDDSWRDLVEYLREKEERSLLIFRREKKEEIELTPEKKVNIAEIYFLFLEKKNSLILNLSYLDEDYDLDFEEKYKEILSKKEGRFSELIRKKPLLDAIGYFLVLCDMSNKNEVILKQEEFLGEIYFKVKIYEGNKANN
ncbi:MULTISPECIES: rifampin ADP-ribosyl transferase [Dictyoglomus]|jgi:segregation and condensation protein A|uniref:Chromosome segregation and condensation protein ScpA n=1 Tax=Dictyoglomus turgidum (strain DSM 6724 / Z-1310) TaxID=515635 RepID=B8E105_DICTD|nr:MULTISPECIES: rifampin ADP-ribosyl transferase [Dictyoglomus]ACK42742.1 chromosome segregation and condensation protein ScpA [Dictyoglomus turgidum DSM 6724]HBU30801.1 rifampin ADP-ribosyl transferase [Dictyoglomus sp.]